MKASHHQNPLAEAEIDRLRTQNKALLRQLREQEAATAYLEDCKIPKVYAQGVEYGARCAAHTVRQATEWAAGGFQLSLGFSIHNKSAGIAICAAYNAMVSYYCHGAPENE